MTLHEFTAEMTRRGCISDGKNFCGSYEGFPFSTAYLKGKTGGSTAFVVRIQFEQKVQNKLFKQLQQQMKGLATMGLLNSGSAFILLFNVTVKKNTNFDAAFDTLMQALVNTARQFSMSPPAGCPVCKRLACDSYAYHGNAYVPVHAACVQQQTASTQAKIQKNLQKGNYFLGFLGAIIGGLVGTIPTLLVIAFMNVISAWLCALIPLGAYGGYRLFRGKRTRVATAIIVLVTILLVPVVDWLSYFVINFFDDGFVVTPALYIAHVMVYPADFLPELVKTLIFMGLGLLFVSGIISRTSKHEWEAANFSAATLRPIDPNAPVPPAMALAGGAPPATSLYAPAPEATPMPQPLPGAMALEVAPAAVSAVSAAAEASLENPAAEKDPWEN